MKWILKGNLFLEQMKKALFLFQNGISTIIENDALKCTNLKDYIDSLFLLNKNNFIDKKECDDSLKEVYQHLYRKKLLKQLQTEQYQYNSNQDNVIIYCKGKYLLLKKVHDKDFSHYYIAAEDTNIDKKALDVREIPFLIRKDSPIYSCLDNYYKYYSEKIISMSRSQNDNYVKIEKDENDDYILSVQKVRTDRIISDDKQAIVDMGTPYTNDKYMMMESIFESISMLNKTKKRKIRKCKQRYRKAA